jgi:hypothetical protein
MSKAGAAAAVVVIAGALTVGTIAANVSAGRAGKEKRRASVQWQGDKLATESVRCIVAIGYAQPAALALFGLQSDGGPQYVKTRVCAVPDAGSVNLPGGMTVIDGTQVEELYDGGSPQMEASLQGESEFVCACSTGSDCEMMLMDGGWGAAGTGNTLAAGRWRGSGCFRKSCVELFGQASSWPQECP